MALIVFSLQSVVPVEIQGSYSWKWKTGSDMSLNLEK
jgi:hypothetical protein